MQELFFLAEEVERWYKDGMEEISKIAIFKGRKVRKTIYHDEWWFVVEDVVLALVDSVNVKDYINKMRRRDQELSKGYGQIVHTLEIPTEGGMQMMNCANTEGIFRIIQSIPSPKSEPFKRWFVRQGGTIAGNAKRELELKSGQRVSTSGNYLKIPQKRIFSSK